jgi:hypothetical protein
MQILRYGTIWGLILMWLLLAARLSRGLLGFVYPASGAEYTFTGYYRAGFETSSFVACDSFGAPGTPNGYDSYGIPGYGRGYWLKDTADSGFWSRFAELTPQFMQRSRVGSMEASPSVFVRFIGHASPRRSLFEWHGYGHLGLYDREITVTRLIEMRVDTRPGAYLILQALLIFGVPLVLAVVVVRFATSHWSGSIEPTRSAVYGWILLLVLLAITFTISSLGLQLLARPWTCQ